MLYHKGDLTEAGEVGVPAQVFHAIENRQQRVVGVVINAVDDHLTKGEQVRVQWRIRTIKPLQELLSAARTAGRAVILISDHGHVLEHGTTDYGPTPGDAQRGHQPANLCTQQRWRHHSNAPTDKEVILEGPRVLLNGGKLIAPWSETVRFSKKDHGYHGGAAAQEVVIPLGVFASPDSVPDGWQEVAAAAPDWWQEPDALDVDWKQPATRKLPPIVAAPPPQEPGEQGRLFANEDEALVQNTNEPDALPWLESLLVSPLMASRRRASARLKIDDARLRDILTAMDERGGKLTRTALSKRLGVSMGRVGGIVSVLRRLLNVDGYDVLSVDESSDTIVLNRDYLETQFGL